MSGQWDISSAGDASLISAQRELQEELGITLPKDAFEKIFVFLQECVINDGKFINNEYNDVYLVSILHPITLEAFTLQEEEVCAVKYIPYEEYRSLLAKEDPAYVPYDVNGEYGNYFDIIRQRCQVNTEERSLSLKKQLQRYTPVTLEAQLSELSEADQKASSLIVKGAKIMDVYVKSYRSSPYGSIVSRKSKSMLQQDFPYSKIYRPFLIKAAELLHGSGDLVTSQSLKKLLHSKAEAFLSNDYYESDIAWMDLDSKLDITICPYDTYEDENQSSRKGSPFFILSCYLSRL